MSSVHSVSYEKIEKKRRQATDKAQKAMAEKQKPVESETLAAVHEIMNPTFKFPVSKNNRYVAPNAINRKDPNVRRNLDFQKFAELKEAFAYLDIDGDGYISKNDLRKSFTSFGHDYTEEVLDEMLEEAKSPLNLEAFVELMTYHIVELDSEEILLEALSKWDTDGSGQIDEKKIFEELTNFGDKMTELEAQEALCQAPMIKAKSLNDTPKIDYPAFCKMLGGVRKSEHFSN